MKIRMPRFTRAFPSKMLWRLIIPVLALITIVIPVTVNAKESEARAYTTQVKAILDTTTMEQMFVQMPDNIQPEMRRDGGNRTVIWSFGDGSKLKAVFRPLGGEGSRKGLVLYMVDVIE